MKGRLALFATAARSLAAGCGGQPAPEAPKQPRPAASERTGSAGVTVELPSGWHTTTWNDGNITDPLTRVIAASAPIRPKCLATARKVGYAVPCPAAVPTGLVATAGHHACELDIIGPGGTPGCGRAWRGWVVGSSETREQHLVITASPRPLKNYARLANGPAWYPSARVRPLAWITVGGWHMRAVYAPRATNAGSAFADHVLLIWTVQGHTYGIGFHNECGLTETLRLTRTLARGIELVAP